MMTMTTTMLTTTMTTNEALMTLATKSFHGSERLTRTIATKTSSHPKAFAASVSTPNKLETPNLDGGREVSDTLSMMLHIADENAAEYRYRSKRRSGTSAAVTPAVIEKQEWEAFKAKLAKRSCLLERAPAKTGGISGKGEDGEFVRDVDVDEDDVDMLLSMIDTLERAKASRTVARTISEISRALQADGVLAVEFTAAARAQTLRLLNKLREMNRVYQDPHGRWALL